MICLDTNYLILGLVDGTHEASQLVAWSQAGEKLMTPLIVWFEFLCGPVTPKQVATMRAFLDDVTALGESEAVEAARLFNAVGRRRSLRVDSLIAASAIVARAQLATNDRAHFEPFAPLGLQLR